MAHYEKPPDTKVAYDVGYGKPPKAHQWVKGQSGNPAGKKKGTKNLGALFCKVVTELVPGKKGGKNKHIPLIEVLVSAPIVNGNKGDKKNLAYALELAEEFSEAPDTPTPPKSGSIIIGDDGKPKIVQWLSDEQIAADREALRVIMKTAAWLKSPDGGGNFNPAE